jgi:hypothetical protein
MVERPKHVAANLNKLLKYYELRRRKPLTLIWYSQQDANTQDQDGEKDVWFSQVL